MPPPDLQQALVELQVAALQQLAIRQGVPTTRQELMGRIQRSGIESAYRELQRPRSWPKTQVANLGRLVQRWFKRS